MVLFKSRKIKQLLDEYRSPQVNQSNNTIVTELKQFGTDAIHIVIEYFQQRKLTTPKGQYLLNKLCDSSCQELIIPLIGDSYDEVRRVAKEMIKERWSKSASQLLLEHINAGDIYMRNNATELLIAFADKSCEPKLISIFNTSASEQKKSILKILTSFNSFSGNKLILSALNDPDWQVRLLAVKCIGKLNMQSAVGQLIEKLSENEPQIKAFTIQALGELGDKQATRPLLDLLKDGDLMVRQKAVDALIEIADAGVIKEIIALLRDNDVNVRRCAVEVLRNMKDPQTGAALMQAIKDSDWWVRQIATDSLTSLKSGNIVEGFIGLTKDPDENIRRCAVEFFIQVPAPEAFNALISLLDDPDWWVRERAIDALGTQKNPEAIEHLLKKVDDQAVSKALPRAFADIGGETAEHHLLDLLYRGPKRLRLESLKILVEKRGVECVDLIKACVSDPEPEISSEAINVLKELTGKVFSQDDVGNTQLSLIQSSIAPGQTVTEAIVVIDLCNSTDITSRYGDSFALDLLQQLTSVVNPVAQREKCQFVKGTGDGFLLTFPKAENAIRFSFDVLTSVQNRNKASDPSQHINLRFAVNFGESKVDDKGDRLGAAISMTFRVEGLKPPDAIATEGCMPTDQVPLDNRVFITENIEKEISGIKSLNSQLVGLYELKGITGLHRIYYLTGTL